MEIKSWLVAVSIPSHSPEQIASDIQIEKRAPSTSSTNKTPYQTSMFNHKTSQANISQESK
jgi:hypothetical protein